MNRLLVFLVGIIFLSHTLYAQQDIPEYPVFDIDIIKSSTTFIEFDLSGVVPEGWMISSEKQTESGLSSTIGLDQFDDSRIERINVLRLEGEVQKPPYLQQAFGEEIETLAGEVKFKVQIQLRDDIEATTALAWFEYFLLADKRIVPPTSQEFEITLKE